MSFASQYFASSFMPRHYADADYASQPPPPPHAEI